jgi:hypothetical protein
MKIRTLPRLDVGLRPFFLIKERVNNNLSLYAASFRRKLPIFLIK